MTHHLEVEVTWKQHKTPWTSGLTLVTDEGDPLELNGLDAAHTIYTNGFGSEK